MLIWPTVLARQLAKYDQSLSAIATSISDSSRTPPEQCPAGVMNVGLGMSAVNSLTPLRCGANGRDGGQFQTQPFTLPTDDVAGQERVNKADLLSTIIARGEFV